MINSRLARGLVAVLCLTALVVLSLYTAGRLATDSTVGTTACVAVGGLLAGAALGLFRYLTGLVRAGWRQRDLIASTSNPTTCNEGLWATTPVGPAASAPPALGGRNE